MKSRDKATIGLFLIIFIFSFAHMTLRIPWYWMAIYMIYLSSQFKIEKYVRN